jgi:hypothetical protein
MEIGCFDANDLTDALIAHAMANYWAWRNQSLLVRER